MYKGAVGGSTKLFANALVVSFVTSPAALIVKVALDVEDLSRLVADIAPPNRVFHQGSTHREKISGDRVWTSALDPFAEVALRSIQRQPNSLRDRSARNRHARAYRRGSDAATRLTHVASMPEGIPAGLRPHR